MKKKNLIIEEFGKIIQISGPVIKIEGLPEIKNEEIIKVGKQEAIVFKFCQEFTDALLNMDITYALLLGDPTKIKVGAKVERTREILKIPIGEKILGNIIDPLGKDIQTGEVVDEKEFREIDIVAPQMIERKEIRKPLETGIKVIDALFPIGRGQRELIIGDRKTGKTTIAVDTILNQEDVICIFCAIGKKKAEVLQIFEILKEYGALEYSTIVSATSSDSVVLQYLAPFSAMTIAEYFRDEGKDVLVIFDDLTKHAWAWREISLLLERPPGREAFPGDIFYLHARLLERAGNFRENLGGGSITALPICETKEGDITEYIPTNLISITDGQLYLETNLFQKGIKPAINIGLSVSRIGSLAQRRCLKEVTQGLKLVLSQHKELKKLVQLETKLSLQSQKNFHRGELLLEIFKQEKRKLVDGIDQSMIYFAILNGFLDDLKVKEIKEFERNFYKFIDDLYPELKKEIERKGWNERTKKIFKKAIEEFKLME
jgi:F-type H+-transporting ATPase subunit alpha